MTAKRSKSHRPVRAQGPDGKQGFLLKLFIAGMSARSVSAIRSIKRICDEHLAGDYKLEIVDLYRQPHRAKEEQIVAAPTLIKQRPEPLRRIVGSMQDEDRVMLGLNVKKK